MTGSALINKLHWDFKPAAEPRLWPFFITPDSIPAEFFNVGSYDNYVSFIPTAIQHAGGSVNVLKKVHNLRHRIAPACEEIPFPENHPWLKLRLRESQSIFAEFMDFVGTFTFSLFGLLGI